MALESCNFKIKNFLDNLKNKKNYTNNLLEQKHCVEIPIIHEKPDFELSGIIIPDGAEIF